MEKIKQTFINIYSGDNAKSNHLMFALILLGPALAAACFQMIDKEHSEYNITMIIAGLIIFALSIPMFIAQIGVYAKYINNKFRTDYAFPPIDGETFMAGLKTLPVTLAWICYISSVILLYIVIFIATLVKLNFSHSSPQSVIAFLLFIAGLFILMAGLIVISPFVNVVFIKFAKNFKYRREIFNPLTPFKIMKKAFVPIFIIALKYMLISWVLNLALMVLAALLIMLITTILVIITHGPISETSTGFVFMFIITAITTWLTSYVTGIITYAYTDNVTEYYKNELDTENTLQLEE